MVEPDAQCNAKNPMVSVIIPCFDDAESIGDVLDALAQQRYPRECIEVIVVDNGSTDGSQNVVRTRNVRLLAEPIRSAYVARNRGITESSGAFLLFLDADTIPCPDWVTSLVRTAIHNDADLVGGRIENVVMGHRLGDALLAHTHSAQRRQEAVEVYGRLSGGNMLVARSVFKNFGLFLPVQSGADGEFSERANPLRKSIPFANDAVVSHRCNIGTRAYLRRAFRIARGQAQTRRQGGKEEEEDRSVPLPWRPGFRRAIRVRNELALYHRFPLGYVLLVLWLERWFFFSGYRMGCAETMDGTR